MENRIDTITNLFEGSEIRSVWDSEKEEYYFSVIDVISALTNSNIPKRYWTDLKKKLIEEGSQLYENIVRLKMKAKDGKFRETDVLDTKGIFRLIESIPSPKAEPFKLWLSSLAKERIDEVFDPEIAINRSINYYRKRGYSDSWIEARLKGILNRKKLIDTWEEHGISNDKLLNRINGVEADCIIASLPYELEARFTEQSRLSLNAKVWFGIGNKREWDSDKNFVEKMRVFLKKLKV